jgi:hypothetical protein
MTKMRAFHALVPVITFASTCNFNITLKATQCFGLTQTGATTAASCETACCDLPFCNVWEFCPDGTTCTGYTGPSCWVGSVNVSACTPEASWNGAARTLPPPPPRPAESFLVPLSAAVPLALVDLASSGTSDASWSLSVDGNAARSVFVPGGGYNSDEQELPFLNR